MLTAAMTILLPSFLFSATQCLLSFFCAALSLTSPPKTCTHHPCILAWHHLCILAIVSSPYTSSLYPSLAHTSSLYPSLAHTSSLYPRLAYTSYILGWHTQSIIVVCHTCTHTGNPCCMMVCYRGLGNYSG